jgi:hypothetical protein
MVVATKLHNCVLLADCQFCHYGVSRMLLHFYFSLMLQVDFPEHCSVEHYL